jgi:hypothetical protein
LPPETPQTHLPCDVTSLNSQQTTPKPANFWLQ